MSALYNDWKADDSRTGAGESAPAATCLRLELEGGTSFPTLVAPTGPALKEWNVSEINGDQARFHRNRKQDIAKFERTRELLVLIEKGSRSTAAARWWKS
jgi:hypothetical protein